MSQVIKMDENPKITENPCSPAPYLPTEMMEKILQHLPLKDLLICRLVWKDHDALMKAFIGKKMKPILFDLKTGGLRDHLKNCPNSPVPDALHLKLTFEEDHETIKEICENLRGKIKHLTIDMNNYRVERVAEEMIAARTKNHSKQVHSANARLLVHILEILGDSLETVEFGAFKLTFLQTANVVARESSFAGNFNFPSLQKITILGETPEGKSGANNLSFWNQLIFKNCEKLKSFQLQGPRNQSVHVGRKVIDALEDLHEVGRLTQITSLRLQLLESGRNGRYLNPLLKYESCGGLQIEELHIEMSCWVLGSKDVERLERILKMQSKKLKIFLLKGSWLEGLKIPVMEQLTSLKLPEEGRLLDNICFSKVTPKLKSLEVEIGGTFEEREKLFDTTNPCTTLETLKVISKSTFWGRKDPLNLWVCEIFGKNFPSITSLTLGNPSEEFLQRMWTAWPNLLKLDLALCEKFKDLDQALFGITPEWKKSVDKTVDQWWILNEPPPIQSICNLTKLQSLRIHRAVTPKCFRTQGQPQRREIESSFSDFSYFYGLKNMKRLKVFSMNQGSFVPREEEISGDAREFIRTELPLLRIQCYETLVFF